MMHSDVQFWKEEQIWHRRHLFMIKYFDTENGIPSYLTLWLYSFFE